MAYLLIDAMNTAWTSSDPALLQVVADSQIFYGENQGSNRLNASANALNTFAELALATPLDLSNFEEIRFAILSNELADGSASHPFYLEFSYIDANDTAGEEHSWLVPINQVAMWEQRRIGIASDRRTNITSIRLRCIASFPFTCYIDELLAVREEMLADLESTLINHLADGLTLPGLTNIALKQNANPGDTQIVLSNNKGLYINNLIAILQGNSIHETHSVKQVVHDDTQQTTTLSFDAADKIINTLTAGMAFVSVVVPVIIETPPLATGAPSPSVVITFRDIREDPERTSYISQQDSFRLRGTLLACSVRPGGRAYTADYQITTFAPERRQQIFIQTLLLQKLSQDVALYINGIASPVTILPPPTPTLDERRLGLLAPLYVCIGTHREIAPRQEIPLVQRIEIATARPDAPLDQEGIALEFQGSIN